MLHFARKKYSLTLESSAKIRSYSEGFSHMFRVGSLLH